MTKYLDLVDLTGQKVQINSQYSHGEKHLKPGNSKFHTSFHCVFWTDHTKHRYNRPLNIRKKNLKSRDFNGSENTNWSWAEYVMRVVWYILMPWWWFDLYEGGNTNSTTTTAWLLPDKITKYIFCLFISLNMTCLLQKMQLFVQIWNIEQEMLIPV